MRSTAFSAPLRLRQAADVAAHKFVDLVDAQQARGDLRGVARLQLRDRDVRGDERGPLLQQAGVDELIQGGDDELRRHLGAEIVEDQKVAFEIFSRPRRAVVSASANCQDVLKAAGIFDYFEVIVDGVVATRDNLKGKPAPDTFLDAARLLGVDPANAAVFEDATAGVEAGKAGEFGFVVGVDRVDHADELREHGATVVVEDLEELL